ncbi:MAG TPA: hypothetical protein VL371_04230 [Gemmataceae bacterium]|jgi:hypothetical protein|nr:hypothetical protein [Gemmataceae bacterium]
MSTTNAPDVPPTVFEGVTPILYTANLAARLDYYVSVLGFCVDWHYPETIAAESVSVTSDRKVHSDIGDAPRNADALHTLLRRGG